MSINNQNDPENKGNLPLSNVSDVMPVRLGRDINNAQDPSGDFDQFRNLIPHGNPHDTVGIRYIPKSDEERKFNSKFRSLTDIFQPKDQYNRTILQAVTNTTNILNEHIERLKRLLIARGEKVYLVKRILDGEYCTNCYDPITKVIKRKYCSQCYGTRIKGGYQLYLTPDTTDGKIYIAGPNTAENITMENYGRDLNEENEMWTLPYYPLTNGNVTFSYDFIIRFNDDGTEMGRFYITDVFSSRNKDNKVTYQSFKIRLADRPVIDKNNKGNILYRGDIIYELNINKLNVIRGVIPSEWAISDIKP